MKKIPYLLVVAALLLSALTGAAFAEEADFVIEDGVLIEYTGSSSAYYANGALYYGKDAFLAGCRQADVDIPEGVTSIGHHAFYFAVGVTGVTIPEGVTEIGESAFNHCSSMTWVNIPNSVTTIGDMAFFWCALKSVTIPSGVTEIGADAFRDIETLTIHGAAGSYAETYAKEHGIPFAADLARAAVQNILVDGVGVEFHAYALTDENGGVTNYVRVRDVADVLNGTAAQFQVGWDGAVDLTAGAPYTPNGSEMSTPFSGDRAYAPADAATVVNGSPAALDAIVLTDENGGAYTYYRLRDLGKALGFQVGWSAESGVSIETGQPYSET